MGEPGIAPRGGDFAGGLKEHLFEQFGVENSLRCGETAKTHRPSADVLLHSLEVTRRAKGPRMESTTELSKQKRNRQK